MKKEMFLNAAAATLASARVVVETIRKNQAARKIIRAAGVAVLSAAIIAAYTLVISRSAATKAVEQYKTQLADQMEQEEEAARLAAAQDPYTLQLNAEAESLARVLYGVRDNSTDDLKTYCWCVFNRVENAAFPSTLEDVIAQPGQWMRYDQTNPILEPLYQLAREQLDAWHTDDHRPVSSDYVFMTWSANDICLRDNFHAGSNCHYWRWGQK